MERKKMGNAFPMKHCDDPRRLAASCFSRNAGGGKSTFGRILDYVLLRLLLFAGAYLYFASLTGKRGPSLLLALIFLGLCMVVLRIVRMLRMEKATRVEMDRVKKRLTADRLLLLTNARFSSLAAPLCRENEQALLLPTSRPAEEWQVLSAIRSRQAGKRKLLFSLGGFTPEAQALMERMPDLVRFGNQAELLELGFKAGLAPGQEEVLQYIAMAERARKKAAAAGKSRALEPALTKKYWITGLVLFGLSFITKFGLYFRLMSGLCMTLAGAGLLLWRSRSTFQS
jgi:hypothetical protein